MYKLFVKCSLILMLILVSASQAFAQSANEPVALKNEPGSLKNEPGALDIVELATGMGHSAILLSNGTVMEWGNGNHTPTLKSGLTNVKSIAIARNQAFAMKQDGTLWTWFPNVNDRNAVGTIQGKPNNLKNLQMVEEIKHVKQIVSGYSHTVVLLEDGTVWSVGENSDGRLGIDSMEPQTQLVQVSGIKDVVQIACGWEHTLALKKDGTVWGWGSARNGKLGNDQESGIQLSPIKIQSLDSVKSIAAGRYHSYALLNDGTVWGWGENAIAQLGNAFYREVLQPQQITGMPAMQSIHAGGEFLIALSTENKIWAFGANDLGQLGSGSVEKNHYPISIEDTIQWKRISAGYKHVLAQSIDGKLYAWGDNGSGQLGISNASMFQKPKWIDPVSSPQMGSETESVMEDQIINLTSIPKELIKTIPKTLSIVGGGVWLRLDESDASDRELSILVDSAKIKSLDLNKVAIWRFDDQSTSEKDIKGQWVSMGGSYDSQTKRIKALTKQSAIYLVMYSKQSFDDIKSNPYKKEIEVLVAKGLMKPANAKQFKPNDGMTRAEFVKLLVDATELSTDDAKTIYKDVSQTHWAHDYVYSVYRADGFVGAQGSSFYPDQKISREQAAWIARNLFGVDELNAREITQALSKVTDRKAISSVSKKAFAELLELNVITYSKGKMVLPKQEMKRSEAAKLVHSLMVWFGKW